MIPIDHIILDQLFKSVAKKPNQLPSGKLT